MRRQAAPLLATPLQLLDRAIDLAQAGEDRPALLTTLAELIARAELGDEQATAHDCLVMASESGIEWLRGVTQEALAARSDALSAAVMAGDTRRAATEERKKRLEAEIAQLQSQLEAIEELSKLERLHVTLVRYRGLKEDIDRLGRYVERRHCEATGRA